jgi:hypothetical protein
MTKEEIKRLAERIASGTASEDDIVLYNRICDLAETTVNEPIKISAAEKLALEAVLKRNILRKTGGGNVYRMSRLKWAAAAAVLILLAGVGYVFLQSPEPSVRVVHQKPNQNHPFTNDVLPGRQGAILTLANGQKITLDSAANGVLAREGGAQVIKKDGELLYDKSNVPAEVSYNTMTTPEGRQYHLNLTDGTDVWLNAGSSITYPTVFTGKQRAVKITGEVYFEVAHNAAMPFRVEKNDVRVEVLGTHFNMNTYDDESSLKVTLLEGSVRVVSASSGNIITPGQQAQVRKGRIAVEDNVNSEEVMAWKNGRFLFSGTGIDQVMRQLTRWYGVEVVYNKKVNDLFYAEIPRNTNLSDVLKALELTGKVHFLIDGKKIIVMP